MIKAHPDLFALLATAPAQVWRCASDQCNLPCASDMAAFWPERADFNLLVLADNVVLSNPWQNFSSEYDFEGMSDWVKAKKLPSSQVYIC